MTSRQDFTDEEWVRIRRAPLVAGVAISLADPGGPIEVAKETVASLRSATVPPAEPGGTAGGGGPGYPGAGPAAAEPVRGLQAAWRPTDPGGTPGRQRTGDGQGHAPEAEAFRRWLVATAQAAADAAKEGGFLGFGAEQVSAGEKQMLGQVRAALGVA